MITDRQAAKMVRWSYHPGYNIAVAIGCGLLTLYEAAQYLLSGRFGPLKVLLLISVGIVFGIGVAFLHKRSAKKHFDEHVSDAAMDIAAMRMSQASWRRQWPRVLVFALIVVGILLLVGRLEAPWDLAVFAAAAMQILTLPEQRKVFEAAKARVMEMYADEPGTSPSGQTP